MQRNLRIRAVQRLAAPVCLQVHGVAGLHEGGDVGDGVMHAPAVALRLHMHGLIEIARARWIDGDQRQLGAIQPGQARVRRGCRRGGFDFGRKGGGQVHLLPDLVHAPRKHGTARGLQADASRRGHGSSV